MTACADGQTPVLLARIRRGLDIAAAPGGLLGTRPEECAAVVGAGRLRHRRPASAPLKAPAPAAPAPPVCGDPTTLPTRDKLAQLLMVGVRDGADARAVVETYHVGGIFIGSWTDRRC